MLASFLGPAQLFVIFVRARGEPGNEAKIINDIVNFVFTTNNKDQSGWRITHCMFLWDINVNKVACMYM